LNGRNGKAIFMSMRSPRGVERRALAAGLVSISLLLLSPIAEAQEKWLSVPPTPELPLQVSGGHVDRKDALLWYATYGDETKPAVLLLHGGGGSSDYWGHLIRDLMRDYRVVVFDCRGQGRSTNEAVAISYTQMADDALAVLNQLEIKQTSVVGWSDGANIGFYLALKHPQRISALVAFAGNARPDGYQPNQNPAAMNVYMAATNAEYRKLSPHPDQRARTMRLLGAMWKTQPVLSAADLGAIRVRTAILHAEHDEIIRRSHAAEIAKHIPGARFVLLRGVSHFALLQDPEGFNKTVRAYLGR
jgi:pimeloyl-ACP methyl ester carboxylesterase